jgi:hypothetical protein
MSTTVYKGKITTAGSSEAIRFSKELFKEHTEFKQKSEVKAHVIAKGVLLVCVDSADETDNQEDPVFEAFLSFLEKDMIENPQNLIAVGKEEFDKTKDILDGVEVSDEDEMPDDFEL